MPKHTGQRHAITHPSSTPHVHTSASTGMLFFSRHVPTPAQVALVETLGYQDVHQEDLDWDAPNSIFMFECLYRAHYFTTNPKAHLVALVAPLWVKYTLLTKGYRILEFSNHGSARVRGEFICRGATLHWLVRDFRTPTGSRYEQEWVDCPVPAESQQAADLTPVLR